jgi:cytochrome c oxidase subunit 1
LSSEPATVAVVAAPPVSDAEREVARRLTLQYLVVSTAIFLVAGAMGLLLRGSQADYTRIDDNWWYAVMTAHGLGAFVGWAAFAVMGLSYWILAWVGFGLRPLGALLARLTFWLMVVGVAGILVTTLLMDFAASWVFLYPLPFSSAGQWSDTATGIFSASVLLVGLSIITWCLAILHTVVGPALHATKPGLLNRLGVASGFGYLSKKRFPTNPAGVPYAVIPLTVIAIDMIIATLPLAGLLVEMVIQSFADVSVDPLLAKNVLWWFGHPVVYLLLFPAVAIFYFLVPRYAGVPLVAGNVIAVAWVIAVVANVIVFAHHVYLDYPDGTIQGTLNTLAQPVTFALTVPSALSIYSLTFTIYRSNWKWTGASTALFLALFSWLVAGLSGVVNATIVFDEVVHNTLWIVGHFHHMAFANIGLVIFAAIYAFLPELTGKPLWSDGLAKLHVWLTFLLVTANSAVWMVQGLDGAPRRFAVLPEEYEGYSPYAIPLLVALGLAQLIFVWNMVQTLRGAGAMSYDERKGREISHAAQGAFVILAILFAAFMFAVGLYVGENSEPEGQAGQETQTTATGGQPTTEEEPSTTGGETETTTGETETETEAGGGGDVEQGAEIFASAGCASCHTLEEANASGTVGPNLDDTTLDRDAIEQKIRQGGGAMPPFEGTLDDEQIAAVADFVTASAGS